MAYKEDDNLIVNCIRRGGTVRILSTALDLSKKMKERVDEKVKVGRYITLGKGMNLEKSLLEETRR